MSNIVELDNNNYNDFINQKEKLILLYFGAEWCGPCKKVHPILDELSIENQTKISVGHIDIAKYPELAQKYNVLSIPQIIIIKNNEEKEKIFGYLPKQKISEKINNLL